MTQNDPTLSRANLEMVTIAGEYCSLIEDSGRHDRPTFLKTLCGFVPLLYLRGNLLQAAPPEFPEANERFVTEEQWDGIFTTLRELLGEQDEFSYIGSTKYDEQATLRGSLSEHLADVYQDLNDFVRLFKKPLLAARENAIYECQQLFRERWGSRLAIILPVLHNLTNAKALDHDKADDEEVDFLDF